MSALVDDLGLQARRRPDALAIADLTSDRRWTYAAFDSAVARCASVLKVRCVKEGDRVAALSKNRAELLMLHLACARIGAIYVPLNWRLSLSELECLIEDSGPSLLLVDASVDCGSLSGEAMDAFVEEMECSAPYEGGAIDRERPSLILYTSGTSGRPKGALLSERNLAETAVNFSILGEVTEKSVFLCDSPMFHIIGLVTNMRPALMRGAAVHISDGFVPARTLERLGDPTLGVTHYFGVPQMAAMLRAAPEFNPDKLGNLTAVFTGGAPHPEANIREWLRDGIAIVDGFGMSEAGTVLGMPISLPLIERYAGSAGNLTPRIAARIVDAGGADLPPGEAGELLLKGDSIAKGYWRREMESSEAFTDDGWFRTGDIARMNDEGFFWLVDRRKDMFISGGENVYPAEIEAVVAGVGGVKEAAVVGVADERWGEVGRLFWVARENAVVEQRDIERALNAKLARYKIPKEYSRIDALPRNGAGKVLKTELREMTRKGGL